MKPHRGFGVARKSQDVIFGSFSRFTYFRIKILAHPRNAYLW